LKPSAKQLLVLQSPLSLGANKERFKGEVQKTRVTTIGFVVKSTQNTTTCSALLSKVR